MAKESYNLYGLHPLDAKPEDIMYFPVAATQTLAKGDPVILSGGEIAVAVANSSTELCGVMAQDSVTATEGTMVAVYWRPEMLFYGRAASASAETIGAMADLSGSTGTFEVNNAAPSQSLFCILGRVQGETAATDCRNLVVRIVKHAFADLSS
jgi:hypothetical protein